MATGITITYSGKALENGEMDAADVGASIVAFSDFLGMVTRAGFSGGAGVRTTIRTVRPGSLEIEYGIHLLELAGLLMTAGDGPAQLFEYVKQLLTAFKVLRGSPPTATHIEGDNIAATARDGSNVYVNRNVYNLLMDEKTGEAVRRFVGQQAEKGLSVKVSESEHPESVLLEATEVDAASYAPIDFEGSSELIYESIVRMAVEISSSSFREDLTWRFSDGSSRFSVVSQFESWGSQRPLASV